MTKVAVFGAGSWGTAFAVVLANAGNQVSVWGRRESLCEAINTQHENADYLPGLRLPDAITAMPPEKQYAGSTPSPRPTTRPRRPMEPRPSYSRSRASRCGRI